MTDVKRCGRTMKECLATFCEKNETCWQDFMILTGQTKIPMTFAEWDDFATKRIVPPPRPEFSGSEKMTGNFFKLLMEESFREVVHPHVIEMQSKYPLLFTGPWDITGRLKARYPSGRLTDEEYDKKWVDMMKAPSLLGSLTKDKTWQGGTIKIPFSGKD